jgi:hypothetical protein
MLTVNPGITMLVKSMSAEKLPAQLPARNFCIGLIGKMVAILFTYPYYLLRIRMQTFLLLQATSSSDSAGVTDDRSDSARAQGSQGSDTATRNDSRRSLIDESTLVGACRAMFQTEGVRAMFKGLGPHMTNAVLKEAILSQTKAEIAVLVARLIKLRNA